MKNDRARAVGFVDGLRKAKQLCERVIADSNDRSTLGHHSAHECWRRIDHTLSDARGSAHFLVQGLQEREALVKAYVAAKHEVEESREEHVRIRSPEASGHQSPSLRFYEAVLRLERVKTDLADYAAQL